LEESKWGRGEKEIKRRLQVAAIKLCEFPPFALKTKLQNQLRDGTGS